MLIFSGFVRKETAVGDLWQELRAIVSGVNRPSAHFATPTRNILFVSTHCPTRAHAGGLRILDIAARIRAMDPTVAIDIFTIKNQDIDWDYSDVECNFDNVYYANTHKMDFRNFAAQQPKFTGYDIVSFEYLPHPSAVVSFRPHAGKILFTPMESLSRALAIRLKTETLAKDEAKWARHIALRERKVCRLADETVCVSHPDAEYMRRELRLANVTCLETCVSKIEFASYTGRALPYEPFTVLFLAYFGAATNVDALHWYLQAVHPILKAKFPAYRLDAVGRGDLSQFRGSLDPALKLVGEVAELGPCIARAAVGIAPAVSGAGFRGKINQYALFGVPAVASPLAAQGMVYEQGKDILAAADGPDFAAGIAALLERPALRNSMGENARMKCRAHYSWETKDAEIARIFNLSTASQGLKRAGASAANVEK